MAEFNLASMEKQNEILSKLPPKSIMHMGVLQVAEGTSFNISGKGVLYNARFLTGDDDTSFRLGGLVIDGFSYPNASVFSFNLSHTNGGQNLFIPFQSNLKFVPTNQYNAAANARIVYALY